MEKTRSADIKMLPSSDEVLSKNFDLPIWTGSNRIQTKSSEKS